MRLLQSLGMASALLLVSACTAALQPTSEQSSTAPKNIIMVVADGMGPAYVTAYRNYRDNPQTPEVEKVVFDQILTGTASTYPAQVSGYVTDSAASATALASGIKSYNGAIGVDVNKQPVKTVLHAAKLQGMRTGIAVTSQVVHATPAAYVAANESRKNYNQIADSYFDDRINGNFALDVILGGGQSYFERDERNITGEFIDAGYQYVDTYNKLATLTQPTRVLGLFAPVGLPWALDDTRSNRLSYLTQHAIKHLQNPNGYFLLVEASQVDWAGHANDIASAMAEMHDLALTIEFLREHVKQNPDTLVVLTADHSTGGLTIGANGDYRWSPEYLHKMTASIAAITKALADTDDRIDTVEAAFGFALNEDEKAKINNLDLNLDERSQQAVLKAIIDQRTNTGWTTWGHTGVDVDVFAFGQGAEAFRGAMDNTDIAKRIFAFLAAHPVADTVSTENDTKQRQSSDTDNDCSFKDSWRCE